MKPINTLICISFLSAALQAQGVCLDGRGVVHMGEASLSPDVCAQTLVKPVNFGEALDICSGLGMHLPTANEFHQFAQGNGAGEANPAYRTLRNGNEEEVAVPDGAVAVYTTSS